MVNTDQDTGRIRVNTCARIRHNCLHTQGIPSYYKPINKGEMSHVEPVAAFIGMSLMLAL